MRLAAIPEDDAPRPRSRGRCSPTCAAAPGGRRSWRRRARSAHGCRADGARHPMPPRGGPRSRAALPQASAPRWRWAMAGSPTDSAPADALVAVRDCPTADGHVGETLARRSPRRRAARCRVGARHRAAAMADRRAAGRLGATLQTTWVEPGYLETDAAWCAPGGGRSARWPTAARSAGSHQRGRRARGWPRGRHGRPVRALFAEDVVRWGPEATAHGGRRARRRHRASVRVARTPEHRRCHPLGCARAGGRGGRRRRATDVGVGSAPPDGPRRRW